MSRHSLTRTYTSSPYAAGGSDLYAFGAHWRNRYDALLKAEPVLPNHYRRSTCYRRLDTGYVWCESTPPSDTPLSLGTLPAAISIVRGDGTKYFFTKSGTNWTGDADLNDRLSPTYSADGKSVTQWTYTSAQDGSSETFDATGVLTAITTPDGNTQRLTYSSGTSNDTSISRLPADAPVCSHLSAGPILPAGRLLCVTDPVGHQLHFDYDPQGRIVAAIDPAGLATTYTYDGPSGGCTSPDTTNPTNPACAANNLTQVTYPDGTHHTYHYNESTQINGGSACAGQTPVGNGYGHLLNAMTGLDDENGDRHIRWTYNCAGDATSSELATGIEKVTLAYGAPDANGASTTTLTDYRGTVTNPVAVSRQITYQRIHGINRSTGSSQAAGSGCSAAASAQTYDANGNIASRTDFNGNLTTYTHDLARNLETQRVDAAGTAVARSIDTQWHSVWRLPVKITAPQTITTLIYNGDTDSTNGSLVTCAPPGATVPSPSGTGTQPIAVLCRQTEQDTSGISGTPATPRTRAWTYDATGHVLTADGPRTDVNDITTYSYYPATDPDPGRRGHLATVTNALGHVTRIDTYDANGHPLSLTDPNGLVTSLAYDLRGRLTGKTRGGETTSYQYDPAGQLVRLTLPNGASLSYTYDAAHRLTGISDADGNRIAYTLDATGNRIKEDITDPSGQLSQTRQRAYDALNRLYQDIGAQNQTATYTYDANGNRTGVTDPLGRSTTHAYDALNRLIVLTDPANGQTRIGYDGQDRTTQITDPRNLITAYSIDGLGNLLQQSSPDTGTTQSTYDEAGNRLNRTDAKGQSTVTQYDALNRPTQVSYPDGREERYTWDQGENSIGRLTRIDERQDGQLTVSTGYGYDPQGRLTSETRSDGTLTLTTAYAYQNGVLTGITYPSGKQVSYARDAQGRINRIDLTDDGQTQTVVSQVAYHPFGGLKSYVDGAGQVIERQQDTDGRTSAYSLGSGLWQLGYDAAGRITSQSDGTNAASYGYDSLDRLTSAVTPTATLGYGYDANGNRTSQTTSNTTSSYQIDPASNRLLSIAGPTPRSYVYDANGSVIDDGQAQYHYDARGRLTQATTADGSTQYRIDAEGRRIAKTNATGDTRYVYDRAGHLLAEIDANGKATREYLWLGDVPVGVVQSPTGAGFELPLGFAGQVRDRETGLSQNWFRDYSPGEGRYWQFDLIGLGGGINGYTYAVGNPISYIDPKGLDILVIENGPTAGNPIGHTAIAIPGFGVYSSGNGYIPGYDALAYLAEQAQRRDSTVYVIPTTPDQDDAARAALLRNHSSGKIPMTFGNCSDKSNDALTAAGISDTVMTNIWPGSAGSRAKNAGATVYQIPREAPIPSALRQFSVGP